MTARLDWNPNPRTPGPMPWPEIPLRSNSTARARTPWHREPRGEVVTGTEDQSSPHSLICEKPDERGSWFEESSPRSSAWDTGPDLRRDHQHSRSSKIRVLNHQTTQRLLGKPSRSPGTHPMEICLKIEAANGSSDGLNFNPMKEYMILSGPQKIAIAVLCTLLGLLSALENLVVLYLIVSSHRLRKKPSYLFIGSLAGADFLASVVFASSFVHFHVFDGVDSKAVFLLKIGSVTLTFTASLGSLLLTAIDRYLCLRYPPTYKALLTRRRALVTLGIMWVLAALVSYLPLMGWTCCPRPCSELFPLIPNDYLLGWLLFIAALFAGIIYTYAHVLWKAHQHVASLAEHRDRHLSGMARMRLDVRLAKTLGMLLAVLFIFWFPVLALMVYSLGARLSDQVKKVFAFCSLLCLVNSMVNPIIYALRSGEIRSSAHHRLARWKKCVRGLGPEGKGEIPRSSVTETEADVKTTPGLDSRELSWPDEL